MTRLAAAWTAHPGRWLVAALTLVVAAHLWAERSADPGSAWLLLDFFLAYRVYRHRGGDALWWWRALQVVGVLLLATGVSTTWVSGPGPERDQLVLLALNAAALTCMLSPALGRHVRPAERAMQSVAGSSPPR